MELNYDFDSMDEYGELKKTMSEFIVNCYYNHERNWKPTDYNTLKALLWIAEPWTVIKKIFDINRKLEKKLTDMKEKHNISLLDREWQ